MNEDEQQVCDERAGLFSLHPALPEFPKRRRRIGIHSKFSGRDHADEEEQEQDDENKDDEDEDEEDEFEPSEGSENEMETEILDYM
ncbi:hypothetical protein VZT92_010224 [Zoarces viviparus]|uniref:Uncharacterized protein n=1 Tax=Zoarces viviparus TaxID=48416 RepID=A0AAW1FDG2_ZOAVI